ncbi:MAG: cysteine hydrolase family protein [Dehalococcoidia bacterium]
MGLPLQLREKVKPAQSALIVVDYQNDFVARGGALDQAGLYAEGLASIEEPLCRVIDGARRVGCRVIFLRCEYNSRSECYLSEAWLDQAARRWKGLYLQVPVCVAGTWGAEFCGRVQPQEGDIVVTKHRFGAFEGTDLDLVLRANRIRTLIFAGVVTHVCVESTVRQAFFKDYFCVVPADVTAGWNEEWHRTSLAVMDWGFAEVVNSSALLQVWASTVANDAALPKSTA